MEATTATSRLDPGPPGLEAATEAEVIRTRGLTCRFGGTGGAHDVDLHVGAGRILGLVGPSGCGKTTLVRLLLGLLAPEDGSVELFGLPPRQLGPTQRRRIGYLPQEPALDPDLSLRHNLQFMASLYGMPWRGRVMAGRGGRAARRRVGEVLDLVDLASHQRTRLRDASTGEQRRLALAATMVHEPDLLVLDEPTAGVDPVLRQQLWRHLQELRSDGATVVVTTQYVTEADDCDLVGLMVDGALVALDSPERLRQDAFGGELLDVEFERDQQPGELAALLALPGVRGVTRAGDPRRARVQVDDADRVTPEVVAWGERNGLAVVATRPRRPSFDEVFIALVGDQRTGREPADHGPGEVDPPVEPPSRSLGGEVADLPRSR